jgi:predicted dehydrogenase
LGGYARIKAKEPDKFEIAAVCDPNEEGAKAFAAEVAKFQPKPKVFTKLDRMLAKVELDAADICTPHGYHHTTAIACLEAGLHVQVEKPFGITIAAGRKIMEAAKKHKRMVAAAENHSRTVGQRSLRWALQDEKMIGDMRMFYAHANRWRPQRPEPGRAHWRMQLLESGCGGVMDSGAHYAQILRSLFGDVDTVFADTRTFEKRAHVCPDSREIFADVEDTWMAMLKFESGLTGLWSFSDALPGEPAASCMYYGSKGSLKDTRNDVFHTFTAGALITLEDGKTVTHDEILKQYMLRLPGKDKDHLFPYGFADSFTLECYDFLRAVQTKRPPEIDGWEGLKTRSICEAIYESAFSGQAVKVQDVFEGKVDGYQRAINEHWQI